MAAIKRWIIEGPFPRSWTDEDWAKDGYLNNKLTTIKLFSIARPHMMGFHLSWFSFFAGFIMWFAIPSIMPTLKKPGCLTDDHPVCLNCFKNKALLINGTLDRIGPKFAKDDTCQLCAPRASIGGCGGLGPSFIDEWYKGPTGPLTRKAANYTKPMGYTNDEITYSNVAGVGGTIFVRLFIGPFAEQYGCRLSISFLLVLVSLPGFLFVLLSAGDYQSFIAARFFISWAGAFFVTTSLWTSTMFAHTVVGFAIATTAGWGNLGGGVTLAMHPVIFDAYIHAGYTNDAAWRATLLGAPGLLALLGFLIFFFGDDCPTGNLLAMKKKAADKSGEAPQRATMGTSFILAAKNYRTWIMMINYAFSFGIELVVNKNVVLYFTQAYGMSQFNAGLAGSMFGLTNIFARSLGGYISDAVGPRFGIVGRMWCQFWFMLLQSLLMIGFSAMTYESYDIGSALAIFTMWAILLAMANGSAFGVCPFIEPYACGGVSAFVGAGGNVGAVVGNLIMVIGTRPAFALLGFIGLAASLTVPLIHFQDTREGPGGSMFSGGMPRSIAWKKFFTVKGRTFLNPLPRAAIE